MSGPGKPNPVPRAVIGYPMGQDCAILPALDYLGAESHPKTVLFPTQ